MPNYAAAVAAIIEEVLKAGTSDGAKKGWEERKKKTGTHFNNFAAAESFSVNRPRDENTGKLPGPRTVVKHPSDSGYYVVHSAHVPEWETAGYKAVSK